jgi:hypothetical protein
MATYRIQGVVPWAVHEYRQWPAAKACLERLTYDAIAGLAGLDTRWGHAMMKAAKAVTKPDHVGGGSLVHRHDGSFVVIERVA